MCACMLSCFSRVQLFATPWTVAHQASLSMGFSRQEYLSGLPCHPPGDLPNPGIQATSIMSPALAGRFSTRIVMDQCKQDTKQDWSLNDKARGRLISDQDVFGISLQFDLRSSGIKFWNLLCSYILMGFPGDSVVKNPPANAGDEGLIPGWGRPPGKGNGSPVQYSCLENPMDRGAWWAI